MMFGSPGTVDSHDFLIDDFERNGTSTDEQNPENRREK
jgi:hypothetical protein